MRHSQAVAHTASRRAWISNPVHRHDRSRGQPHFSISDEDRRTEVIRRRLCGLCGLCGKRLDDGAWLIGGPRCFLDENGAFVDPASHEACARFAMQICPYLAAPSYAKRLGGQTLTADLVPSGAMIILDENGLADRPARLLLEPTPRYVTVPAGAGLLRAGTKVLPL